MLGFSKNYSLLYVGEFLGAIGFALMSGADSALFYDSVVSAGRKKDSRRLLANYEAVGTLGIVVALPLGSFIGAINYPASLPWTFVLTAICAVFAGFVFFSCREPRRRRKETSSLLQGVAGISYLLKNKKLLAFALNSTLISAVLFFMFWFYQPLLLEAGLDFRLIGFVGGGLNLFAFILLMNLHRIEKFVGLKDLIFYTALIPSVLLILSAFERRLLFLIPAVIVISGFKLFRYPVLLDFMNKHIKRDRKSVV